MQNRRKMAILTVSLALFLAWGLPYSVSAVWNDADYFNRIPITVNKTDNFIIDNYVINISLNTTNLYNLGYITDCDAFRFYSNNTASGQIQQHWIANCELGNESTPSRIFIRMDDSSNKTMFLYFNNTVPKEDINSFGKTYDMYGNNLNQTSDDDMSWCYVPSGAVENQAVTDSNPFEGNGSLVMRGQGGTKEGGFQCIPERMTLEGYCSGGWYYMTHTADSKSMGVGAWINDTNGGYRMVMSINDASELAIWQFIDGVGTNVFLNNTVNIQNKWVWAEMCYNESHVFGTVVNQKTNDLFAQFKTPSEVSGWKNEWEANRSIYQFGNFGNTDNISTDLYFLRNFEFPEPFNVLGAIESFAPAPPNTPPNITFVPPTDENVVVTANYTFVNVTIDENGNCKLEWNGTNETMSNTTMTNFYVNKTLLPNGNYTFKSYCNDTFDLGNVSGSLWVFINYTAPIPPTPTNITLGIERQFCYNDDYLFVEEPFVSDNGSIVFSGYLIQCERGCSNWTLTSFGNPACIESDFTIALIMIVILIIIVIGIRVIFR